MYVVVRNTEPYRGPGRWTGTAKPRRLTHVVVLLNSICTPTIPYGRLLVRDSEVCFPLPIHDVLSSAHLVVQQHSRRGCVRVAPSPRRRLKEARYILERWGGVGQDLD